jgi:hypothetical protein
MRVRPNCVLEQELWSRGVTAVAGVDEVGVGALAGPVMAAAVILAPDAIVDGLADSKLLTPKRREALFWRDQRTRRCYWHRAADGGGSGSAECILSGDGGTRTLEARALANTPVSLMFSNCAIAGISERRIFNISRLSM